MGCPNRGQPTAAAMLTGPSCAALAFRGWLAALWASMSAPPGASARSLPPRERPPGTVPSRLAEARFRHL